MTKVIVTLLLGVLCVWPQCLRAQALPLSVRFDDKGLASLTYRETVLVTPDGARFLLFFARLQQPDGTLQQHWNPKPTTQAFQPDTRTLTETYPWGEISCAYDVTASELAMTLTVRNTGDRPIAQIQCVPLRLLLPKTHGNLQAGASELGTLLEHASGRIAFLASGHGSAKMHLQGWAGSGAAYPITADMAWQPTVATHPIIDNRYFNTPGGVIAPGETATLSIRLVFGEPDATVDRLVPPVYRAYADARPMTLRWPDRRPIGTIFYAHPGMRWPTNPRGFNFGKAAKHDVFTEEGRAQFETELMAYADRCIANMQAMQAQGVIIWDLEGEEMPHMISYVGDPRTLPLVAPELDRVADAFMKKFRDAGLKTGITLRPTEYYERTPGKRDWWHREVPDPVALMSEKITYAQKRWGCTIFYLDSNVFNQDWVKYPREANVPWTMPVGMIQALHEKHPDCLIIPEWSNREYHRFSAPYASCNLGQLGSDPTTRKVWPESFQVVAVNSDLMERHWESYVTNVMGGDVLLFPCWYPAQENAMVEFVYREARYRTTPSPLQTAALPDLLKQAQAPEEAVRYTVARRLAEFTTPEALAQTAAYLDDPSVLIRKCALVAIARQGVVGNPAVVTKLVGLLPAKDAGLLRPFAGTALGRLGEAAAPQLIELAGQKVPAQRYAVKALGATGTRRADAVATLLPLAQDPANAPLREDAVAALGLLKATEAVPALLAILEDDKSSEPLRQQAVIALGRIGDMRAFEALLREHQRGYHTVVVYSIRRSIDDALAALTGQKGLLGYADWQKWWAAQAQKPAAP